MAYSNLFFGIVLGCVTTFLSAMGLVCKKRAHNRPQTIPRTRSYHKLEWVLGLSFMAISSLASIAVTFFLGQQLASAMAALTLLWGLALRYFLLPTESISTCDVISSLFLASGVGLALSTIPKDTLTDAPSDPRELLPWAVQRLEAQLAIGVFILSIFTLCATLWVLSCARWRPHALLLLSSLFSCATGAFARQLGLILSLGSLGLSSPLLWGSLAGVVGSVILQVWNLNASLKLAPSALVMPLYQALFVLFGVAAGALLWGEGVQRTAFQNACLGGGIGLIVVGLLVLLVGNHPPTPGGGLGDAAPPSASLAVQPQGQVPGRKRCASAPADAFRELKSQPAKAASLSA